MSLLDAYCSACAALGCKANSTLLRTLPSKPECAGELKELDLTLNFVGPIGSQAVVAMARVAPALHTLILRDNQVNNSVVEDIFGAFANHPSLTKLDLSKNPISHTGGKMLSQLVIKNPKICHLVLDETLINIALSHKIEARLQDNATKRDLPTSAPQNSVPTETPKASSMEEAKPAATDAQKEQAVTKPEAAAKPAAVHVYQKGEALGVLLGISTEEQSALETIRTVFAPKS